MRKFTELSLIYTDFSLRPNTHTHIHTHVWRTVFSGNGDIYLQCRREEGEAGQNYGGQAVRKEARVCGSYVFVVLTSIRCN